MILFQNFSKEEQMKTERAKSWRASLDGNLIFKMIFDINTKFMYQKMPIRVWFIRDGYEMVMVGSNWTGWSNDTTWAIFSIRIWFIVSCKAKKQSVCCLIFHNIIFDFVQCLGDLKELLWILKVFQKYKYVMNLKQKNLAYISLTFPFYYSFIVVVLRFYCLGLKFLQ